MSAARQRVTLRKPKKINDDVVPTCVGTQTGQPCFVFLEEKKKKLTLRETCQRSIEQRLKRAVHQKEQISLNVSCLSVADEG